MPAPGAAVAVKQLVPGRRPPGTRCVVREGRSLAVPGCDDRIDEAPLLLDLVRPCEQCRVAEHAVEDQALVRLR